MLSREDLIPIRLDAAWLPDADKIYAEARRALEEKHYETKRFDAATDFNGWLGERAFAAYIAAAHPRLVARTTWINRTAEVFAGHDFLIGDATIDIKTALPKTPIADIYGRLSYYEYLYPESQHPESKDFIVLVYLWPENLEALIVGLIAGTDVANIPVKIKAVENANQVFQIPNHPIKPIAEHFSSVESLFRAFDN